MITRYRAIAVGVAILFSALNVSSVAARDLGRVLDGSTGRSAANTAGGGCPDWSCTVNGRALTGIALAGFEDPQLSNDRFLIQPKQTTAGAAGRGGCEEWGCGATNGTQLTGLLLPIGARHGVASWVETITAPYSERRQITGGGGCPDWNCTTNGTQLSGLTLTTTAVGASQRDEIEVATARRSTAQHAASGRNCPDWQCTTNGRMLTGIDLADASRIDSGSPRIVTDAKQPAWNSGGDGCPDWACSTNGTHLTGLVLPIGARHSVASGVEAITTPRSEHRYMTGGNGEGCPRWTCTSNGTQLTGLAIAAGAIRLDEIDVIAARRSTSQRKKSGQCPEWSCSTNGRALTGIALADFEDLRPRNDRVLIQPEQAPVRAERGGCEDWGCGTTNGTQLTGLVLPIGARQSVASSAEAFTEPHSERRQMTGGGDGCPGWTCTVNGRTVNGFALLNVETIQPGGAPALLSAKQANFDGQAHSGCDDFGCGTSNGTQLTGLVLPIGARQSVASRVEAITTPKSERRHMAGGEGCPEWACTTNGRALIGIDLAGLDVTHFGDAQVELDAKQTGHPCDDYGCGSTNGTQVSGLALLTIAGAVMQREQIKVIAVETIQVRSTSFVLNEKDATRNVQALHGCDDFGCGNSNGTPLTGIVAWPRHELHDLELTQVEVRLIPRGFD